MGVCFLVRKSVSYVTCKQLRSGRGDVISLWNSVGFQRFTLQRFGLSRTVPIATGQTIGCDVMIEFHLSVDALGKTRFAYSPLAEVASSLRLLGEGRHAYVMMPWLREVRGTLLGLDFDLLQALAPPGRWAPEFLFAWSYHTAITIEQQLDAMSRLPGGQIRDDLRGTWKDGAVPPNLEGLLEDEEALPGRVSDLIFDYWQVAIAPYWQRIRSVLDDDVAYRGAKAFTNGIFSIFTDLHPEITLVDRVLKIDKPDHLDASYQGTQITLLPSVFVWPNLIIGHEAPDEFSLIYAARGVGRVWEGLPSTANPMEDLDSLIGRTRAAILRRLDVPMTTTQVARDLHQSPSTVSEHLTVLRSNGLLISWRAGRGVLYRRTPLASSLMAASDAHGKSGQTSAPA
jgi:DNA-binding transcriptional ArsR family regulator